jgi:hypothetical protein
VLDRVNRIIRPKFVALDSSHLGAVARDKASQCETPRRRAAAFERAFEASGSVLLLCWHHVQELLSHRDDEVVAQRVTFIKSVPMVAFVRSFTGDDIIGSVIDLQAHEADIAFREPDASAEVIRDEAAKVMFRLGYGADLIRPFLENWSGLQCEFARQEERNREVVAISRSGFVDISNVKIVDLLKGQLRQPEVIEPRFQQFHARLVEDIRQHGDKRIPNPELSSAAFLDEVIHSGMEATSKPNPVLQILLVNGIDPSEIGPETTVGDVGSLAAFRKKLSVLNRNLGLPWKDLKARVTENRLPSGIIQSALARFRPNTSEWKGSDLTDAYLACLSAYADVTYVDKRTHEAFRRAQRKSKEFATVVRCVKKASGYESIAKQLAASNHGKGA